MTAGTAEFEAKWRGESDKERLTGFWLWQRKTSNSTLNIHLSFNLHTESEKLHESLRESTNLRFKKL